MLFEVGADRRDPALYHHGGSLVRVRGPLKEAGRDRAAVRPNRRYFRRGRASVRADIDLLAYAHHVSSPTVRVHSAHADRVMGTILTRAWRKAQRKKWAVGAHG